MSINFAGEPGLYVRGRDAVKIMGVDGERIISCYVKRSALDAIGCPGDDDTRDMLRHFERERDVVEIAAMVKYRRALTPLTEIEIEAVDLAVILPAAAA